MANLILLEDERILRTEIADFLGELGHSVETAGSITEFETRFQPGLHLIALIDLGLPDGEGMDLITRLRACGEKIGIIVVTARSSSRNRVDALFSGADHYLTKPFNLLELGAIIGALERRLQIGGVSQSWHLDTLRCQLIPPGKPPVQLTAQAYIVLKAICGGAGKPVTRRKIVEALGENYLQYDQRRLDTQMHQLRKTVENASGMALPVRSARGRGYQTTADIILKG